MSQETPKIHATEFCPEALTPRCKGWVEAGLGANAVECATFDCPVTTVLRDTAKLEQAYRLPSAALEQ